MRSAVFNRQAMPPMSEEPPKASDLDALRAELRLSPLRVVRYFYIAAGTVTLVAGLAALFVPGLPTSPLLLLTAFCYARGSERFYLWLITNPHFGRYIRALRNGEGIPLRIKVYAIVMLWATLGSTIVFIVPLWPVKIILTLVGLGVTVYIGQLPTKPE